MATARSHSIPLVGPFIAQSNRSGYELRDVQSPVATPLTRFRRTLTEHFVFEPLLGRDSP
jgi:hypothetical protein